ncbi:hypothetical protein CERSUDRAFT_72025 [Gelatoporia subvermispora B]|uniref:Uncharacterized protein n=1 Tax=Ceriporiopsis subvermispora (strain B) TaxID=914234 RepID=M2QT80_CERS8|nr:hypothetical protein CERSUDRAFT_72025 [Gelatoporia subvermispora B]
MRHVDRILNVSSDDSYHPRQSSHPPFGEVIVAHLEKDACMSHVYREDASWILLGYDRSLILKIFPIPNLPAAYPPRRTSRSKKCHPLRTAMQIARRDAYPHIQICLHASDASQQVPTQLHPTQRVLLRPDAFGPSLGHPAQLQHVSDAFLHPSQHIPFRPDTSGPLLTQLPQLQHTLGILSEHPSYLHPTQVRRPLAERQMQPLSPRGPAMHPVLEQPPIATLSDDDPYASHMPDEVELDYFERIDRAVREQSAANTSNDESSPAQSRRLTLRYVADMSTNDDMLFLDASFVEVPSASNSNAHHSQEHSENPSRQDDGELGASSLFLAAGLERRPEINHRLPIADPARGRIDRLSPITDPAHKRVNRLSPVTNPAHETVNHLSPLTDLAHERIDRLSPISDPAHERGNHQSPIADPVHDRTDWLLPNVNLLGGRERTSRLSPAADPSTLREQLDRASPPSLPLQQLSPVPGPIWGQSPAAILIPGASTAVDPAHSVSPIPDHGHEHIADPDISSRSVGYTPLSGHSATTVGIGIHRGALPSLPVLPSFVGMKVPTVSMPHHPSSTTLPSRSSRSDGTGHPATPLPTHPHINVQPPSSHGREGSTGHKGSTAGPSLDFQFPDPVKGVYPLHALQSAPGDRAPVCQLTHEEKLAMIAALPPSSPMRWSPASINQNASPLLPEQDAIQSDRGGSASVEQGTTNIVGDDDVRFDVNELAGLEPVVPLAENEAGDLDQTQPDKAKAAAHRIAGEKRKHLLLEVLAIDELVNKIAEENGVRPDQVLSIWGSSHRHPRHKVSQWAQYEIHFSYNEEEERQRISPDIIGKDNWLQIRRMRPSNYLFTERSSQKEIVSLCFEAFKAHYKGSEQVMCDILGTSYDIHVLLTSRGRTVGSRKRVFADWTQDTMFRLLTGHKCHGFESAVVCVGSGTFQDDPLSFVWESPGAEARKNSNILRVFGAAMDASGQSPVAGPSCRTDGPTDNSAPSTKSTMSKGRGRPAAAYNTAEDDAMSPKAGSKAGSPFVVVQEMKLPGPGASPDEVLKYNRIRLVMLIYAAIGEKMPSGGHTPWTTIYVLLFIHNLVLENWPEDVPYPTFKDSKGIAGLRQDQRESLMRAFDNPVYPLKCIKNHPLNANATRRRYLAIITTPPAPSSSQKFALRVWFSKVPKRIWTNREGPPRQEAQQGHYHNVINISSDEPRPPRLRRIWAAIESEDNKSGQPSEDVDELELENEAPEAKRPRRDPPGPSIAKVPAAKAPVAQPQSLMGTSKATSAIPPSDRDTRYLTRAPPAKFSKDDLTPSNDTDDPSIKFLDIRRLAPAGGKDAVHDARSMAALPKPKPSQLTGNQARDTGVKKQINPSAKDTMATPAEFPRRITRASAATISPVDLFTPVESPSKRMTRRTQEAIQKASTPVSKGRMQPYVDVPALPKRGRPEESSEDDRDAAPVDKKAKKPTAAACSKHPAIRMMTPAAGPSDGSPVKRDKGKGVDHGEGTLRDVPDMQQQGSNAPQ